MMQELADSPQIVRALLIAFATGAVVSIILSYLATKRAQIKRASMEQGRQGKEFFPTVLQAMNKLSVSSHDRIQGAQSLAKIFDEEVGRKTSQIKQELTQQYEQITQEKEKALKSVSQQYRVIEEKFETLDKNHKKLAADKKATEAVVHSMAEGVIVVNDKGDVLLMNPAAEKLLGVKKEEIIGKSILAGESEERVISFVKGVSGSGSEEKEIQLKSKSDQTQKTVRASNAVIESEGGQTLGMVSVLSDITRQRELNDLKSKFVASVSHELRTPLSTIQETIGLLLDQSLGTLSKDQEKVLSIAQKENRRLTRLIQDLLDLSQLEAGQMRLNPQTFVLSELVRHVMATFEFWGKNKQISLEAKLPPEPIQIEADQDRINQVLTNLMGNACKFTPSGGRICIEMKKIERRDMGVPDWIEISVEDTGHGVPEKERQRIFDKFVQLDHAQAESAKGTGLGLTITKEIVELHGGTIRVDGEEGKGSRFIVQLPQKMIPKQEATQTS